MNFTKWGGQHFSVLMWGWSKRFYELWEEDSKFFLCHFEFDHPLLLGYRWPVPKMDSILRLKCLSIRFSLKLCDLISKRRIKLRSMPMHRTNRKGRKDRRLLWYSLKLTYCLEWWKLLKHTTYASIFDDSLNQNDLFHLC